MSSVKKHARPSKLNTQATDNKSLGQANQVRLGACIAEISSLRYTPAGIPAINLVLEHESEVVEGGVNRQARLIVKAVAFGALVETASHLELGRLQVFTGFLTNARSSKSIVFHIQAIAQVPESGAEQVLNTI